jgi:predicted Rossmann fold flavoprotein
LFDVIILGAGASGFMASCFLKNQKVAIIDKNFAIGEKIRISGGGKCNFTNQNVSFKNYIGDKEFITKTFSKFSNKDLIDFFSVRGLEFKKIKNNQYFCSNSSKEILNILQKESSAKTFLGYEVLEVTKKDDTFYIKTDKREFISKKLVISTGGLSYKSIGATDIGYKIAKSFGHNITKLTPSLVGFTVQKEQFWMKNLSGISVRAKVKIGEKEFIDNILFTHKGISGPAILNASLYWEKGNIEIDFLPDFKLKNSNKFLSTALPLAKRFVIEFLKAHNFRDKAISKADEELKLLKNYSFSPAGNFGYTKAEVTKGGINIKEIKENFESKIVNGLYFIGEILDVTGELGGYNFQWAFSSGVVCAKSLSS